MFYILPKVKSPFILLTFILILCQYKQNIAQTVMTLPSAIAPNHCRIVGKIIEILPIKTSKNPTTPCEKQACQAKVKILKILGYGMGCDPLPFQGTIMIKFAFTLGPTDALFPRLNKAMPGLGIGDSFRADMESMDFRESSSGKYTIRTYTKQ